MMVKAVMIGGNFMHLRYEKRNLAFMVAAGLLVTSLILFSFITPESFSVKARTAALDPPPPAAAPAPIHEEGRGGARPRRGLLAVACGPAAAQCAMCKTALAGSPEGRGMARSSTRRSWSCWPRPTWSWAGSCWPSTAGGCAATSAASARASARRLRPRGPLSRPPAPRLPA